MLNEANLASLAQPKGAAKKAFELDSGGAEPSDRGLGDSPVHFDEDDPNNDDELDELEEMGSISQRMDILNQSQSIASVHSYKIEKGMDFYNNGLKVRPNEEFKGPGEAGRPIHTEDNEAQ